MTLLKALREHGIRIPRDVSVVAFDAPDWSELTVPRLAVVRAPTREIARTAWELLLRRMQAPGLATQRVELPTSLELAESVATIA